MRVKNFTVLISSALMLSASLFLAPAAWAETGPAPSHQLCGYDNGYKFDTGEVGTHTSGGFSVTIALDVATGKTAVTAWSPSDGSIDAIVVNGGSNACDELYVLPATPPLFAGQAGQSSNIADVSHVVLLWNEVDPTATGADACDDETDTPIVNVTVTANDAAGPFDIALGGTVVHDDVAEGTYSVPVTAGDPYSITVAEDGKEAFATINGTGKADCAEAELAVPSAAVAGSCETLSAVVDVTGNEGDEFTVSLNDTVIDTIILDATGAANESYELPENAVSTVTVSGAATDVDTVDCTVDVLDEVDEKEDPVVDDEVDEVDAVVDDEDEVEVLPLVLERDELPRTGDTEDRMLVIALALMGLGLPLTIAKPKAQRIDLA